METNNNTITNVTVKDLTNDELRSLLKEIKVISDAEAPAKVKQSGLMKQLFERENYSIYGWYDKYYNVRTSIEREILSRVRTDKW